jgi:4-hydroxybenzoate polyprenyltransferase
MATGIWNRESLPVKTKMMMKFSAVTAFFRLVRWPNLIFIAMTQSLFYFCIILPSFNNGNPPLLNVLQPQDFFLLSLSSVLIAAAGYIINDYFDLNIDRINKPDKIVVEKIIKRRWAIIWHWVLSGTGILIGFYLSWKLRNIFLGPTNLLCVLLLWFYSTTFKKKLLIGNLLISFLTAWVIGVLYLAEFRLHRFVDPAYHSTLSRIYKFTVLYGAFAFIISLVREVVKDMEDLEGDAMYDCRTMPVVWGLNASKFFCVCWLTLLVAALIFIQFYILQFRWWLTIVFSCVAVIYPILRILKKMSRANEPAQFHELSVMIKSVMMMGILSMILLKYYTSWIG